MSKRKTFVEEMLSSELNAIYKERAEEGLKELNVFTDTLQSLDGFVTRMALDSVAL